MISRCVLLVVCVQQFLYDKTVTWGERYTFAVSRTRAGPRPCSTRPQNPPGAHCMLQVTTMALTITYRVGTDEIMSPIRDCRFFPFDSNTQFRANRDSVGIHT